LVREQVQWTCESGERRELERAAGTKHWRKTKNERRAKCPPALRPSRSHQNIPFAPGQATQFLRSPARRLALGGGPSSN